MAETVTCSTCRYWRHDENEDDWTARRVADDLLVRDPVTLEPLDPQPYPVYPCQSPRIRVGEHPERAGATVIDASGYWAQLTTGPDFGCVAHERAPWLDGNSEKKNG